MPTPVRGLRPFPVNTLTVLLRLQTLTKQNKSSSIVLFGAVMFANSSFLNVSFPFLAHLFLIRSAKRFQKVTLIPLTLFSPLQIRRIWGGCPKGGWGWVSYSFFIRYAYRMPFPCFLPRQIHLTKKPRQEPVVPPSFRGTTLLFPNLQSTIENQQCSMVPNVT